MPCFSPLTGYRSQTLTEKGKRALVFNPKDGFLDMPVQVPCGQCVGCRLERSRQWAIRCMHEAQMHENNCFITLTYDNFNLPATGSLVKRDFVLFMKRLRKKYGEGVRFYMAGEYGSQFRRPHYHACLFNHDFDDKRLWRMNNGTPLYVSESLQNLWGLGFTSVGTVTFESAAYVARYIMKKMTGDFADEHYSTIDYSTGEVHALVPEYNNMSRMPGIGKTWFDKYRSDVFPRDYVVKDGSKLRPPKYYDSQYEIYSPEEFSIVKRNRKLNAKKYVDNNTPERLAVREEVLNARISQLKRTID